MIDIKPILNLMVEHDASDLFLSADTNIALKINGICSPIKDTKLSTDSVKILAYSLMNTSQSGFFEQNLELDFSVHFEKIGRFRINVFREKNKVAMVIRYIHIQVPSIEQLNLPMILKKLVMSPRGLILVVGATGSGKSTSLAAMIDYRNRHKTGHILTIEDPIEYLHPHQKSIVNQREIGRDTHSYKSALRRAMREAPDVILIGEIRDKATMRQVLRYAQTGHLCLSTLHAANAPKTIQRIISFFPETYHRELLLDLSLNTTAIISQRLLTSCDKKRIPAVEIMLNSPYIREQIEKGYINNISEALEQDDYDGMQSMDKSIHQLYKEQKITLKEALYHADSPHNMSLRIRMAEGDMEESDELIID